MGPFDGVESTNLTEAFDDCVERLHAGQSVDHCVQAHPQHAAILRPLLQTVLSVQQANPGIPAGARARVRAQVLHAQPLHTASSWRTRVVLSAAALVFVLAGIVALSRLDRKEDHAPLPTTRAPVTLTPPATAAPSGTPTPTATPCLFTVQESSINLRSGPGTGYEVIAYGFSGDVFPVLAAHTSQAWLKVSAKQAEAWVSASVGLLSGDCAGLPVSDLALKDKPASGGESGGDQGGETATAPGGTGDNTDGEGEVTSEPTSDDDTGGGDSSGDSGSDGSSGDSGSDGGGNSGPG